MNKKTINLFLAGVFFVSISTPKLALFWDKKEKKVKPEIQNNHQVRNPDLGVQQNIKEKVKSFTGKRVAIGTGKVVGIDGESLTIVKDEKTYTVVVDSKTKFRRKFWGNSSLEEISINDLVNVVGRWQNEEKTQIKAVIIRNISVQKRYGVFFGVVTSVTESGFVIQSVQRGNLIVSVSGTTNIVNRVMSIIPISNIELGHRVRVKGTWDNLNSTITNTIQVKDFSIPILSSSTPITN